MRGRRRSLRPDGHTPFQSTACTPCPAASANPTCRPGPARPAAARSRGARSGNAIGTVCVIARIGVGGKSKQVICQTRNTRSKAKANPGHCLCLLVYALLSPRSPTEAGELPARPGDTRLVSDDLQGQIRLLPSQPLPPLDFFSSSHTHGRLLRARLHPDSFSPQPLERGQIKPAPLKNGKFNSELNQIIFY